LKSQCNLQVFWGDESPKALKEAMEDADALIVCKWPMNVTVFDGCKKLKAIFVAGT